MKTPNITVAEAQKATKNWQKAFAASKPRIKHDKEGYTYHYSTLGHVARIDCYLPSGTYSHNVAVGNTQEVLQLFKGIK